MTPTSLFKIYFTQYSEWKNRAIEVIDKNKMDKSTILVSLDIKSFYYSVNWQFEDLCSIVNDKRLDDLQSITDIIEKIYCKYTKKLSEVRDLSQNVHNKEYVLPIGLFSSMLLANMYLSTFDKKILKNPQVLYYGRYVDDMLLVLNVSKLMRGITDEELEKILTIDNDILSVDDLNHNVYEISGHEDLVIQREKLKAILFECGKSEGLIVNLKKIKIIPSQMSIMPSKDIQVDDFEKAVYVINDFSDETKIRDIGEIEVDRLKLAMYMSELVRRSKYEILTTNSDEELRKKEQNKILNFFVDSNAIEYNSNWISALYFMILTLQDKRKCWNLFEDNIRKAIRNIAIKRIEGIKKDKDREVASKIKTDLSIQFDICIATALAINPEFSRKERKEILELCYEIRNANLFNHYLVTFPLANYSDTLDRDIDLSNMVLEELNPKQLIIHKSRKMKLSPRFVNFDELFQFALIKNIISNKSLGLSEKTVDNIRETFLDINCISQLWAKPLNISADESKIASYQLREIHLYGKVRKTDRIKIAVANIKLDIDACCVGLNGTKVVRNRHDFLSFLREAYIDENHKVDYLVFPELYLPLSWMQDVLTYVRKTGITVITGIQYITQNDVAYNNIGVFARVKSGKYNSACVFMREKNNYAPLEKKLLAIEGYRVSDHDIPLYTCINDGGVRLGTFLCYELTDICARSLFKNKADIIFIPENNNDTTYFSNIIETMTRDLHAFMVQSNTSVYGDSRIVGPYDRDHRNIVQIKGGDNDKLIIGTINIKEVITCREKERKDMEHEIKSIFKLTPIEKEDKKRELTEGHSMKVETTSARTTF